MRKFVSSSLAGLLALTSCTAPPSVAPPAQSVEPQPTPSARPQPPLPVTDDAEFAALVDRTYDFRFATLEGTEKKERMDEVDRFWRKVEDDPQRWLPALRHELEDDTRPSYFCADASCLLFTLSKEREDRERILAALVRVDPEEIQPKYYVGMVHELALDGFDTAEAAFKILARPDFSVFLPNHFMSLGQDMSLLVMLLPAKPQYVMPAVERRFPTESDPTAKCSLLLLAYYTVTREGDALITRTSEDARQPELLRDAARKLLAHAGEAKSYDPSRLQENLFEEDAIPQDAASARALRQKYLRGIGDESLGIVDELTTLMRKLGEPRAQ